MIAWASVAAPEGRGEREIAIPESLIQDCVSWEDVAGLAFEYGQNDFQPRPQRASVSVGDSIVFAFLDVVYCVNVEPIGFSLVASEKTQEVK